jgi:hypothetical protein
MVETAATTRGTAVPATETPGGGEGLEHIRVDRLDPVQRGGM